jgi:hypothetical protein
MTKSTLHTVTQRTTTVATGPFHNICAFTVGLISNIAAGASSWMAKFVASLHETRRQQALYTIDRYRHLVNNGSSSQASESKRH